MDPSMTALPWYKKKQWDELKKVCCDSYLVMGKWEDWLIGNNNAIIHLEKCGFTVNKIDFDPLEFGLNGCKACGTEERCR